MSFCPTVDVWLLPLSIVSWVGAPAVAVAWKVSVGTPADEAVMVCAPAVVPSRHDVLASPLAFVVIVVGLA
jgi:hypothetical protein